jgi:hypothetical protein
VKEELEGIPEVFSVDLVGGRCDDYTAECCDDNGKGTGDTLTEQRCVWSFGVSSPVYNALALYSRQE